jgi:hypothetical protein
MKHSLLLKVRELSLEGILQQLLKGRTGACRRLRLDRYALTKYTFETAFPGCFLIEDGPASIIDEELHVVLPKMGYQILKNARRLLRRGDVP